MAIFQRKYGVTLATSGHYLDVPVIKVGTTGYAVSADWTPAVADVRLQKDNGTVADIGSAPTFVSYAGTGSKGLWRLPLVNTELQCKILKIVISDDAIEDQCIYVETYGDANALYPADYTNNDIDSENRVVTAAQGIIYGTVGDGTGNANSTTNIDITSGNGGATSPASVVTGQWKGRTIIFRSDTTTAALRGQGAPIDNSTTTSITVAAGNAFTTAPVNGDVFVIV